MTLPRQRPVSSDVLLPRRRMKTVMGMAQFMELDLKPRDLWVYLSAQAFAMTLASLLNPFPDQNRT